jgi:hypothetical protein
MKKKFSKILGIGLSIALVTSLLVAAVPATALSTATVSVAPTTISKDATYIVEFEVAKQLTGNGTLQDSFTITFPAGTTVAAPTGSIVIGPGWVDNGSGLAWDAVPDDISGGTWTVDSAPVPTWIKYQLPATGRYVGASADVRVEISAGIMNPGTPGDYTLTVATSQETTPKTSSTYTITTPMIDPLSGIVTAYNAAGILMAQSHDIDDCVNEAGVGGRVEIGPGTYTVPWDADIVGQTIIGTGDPGTVIIKAGAVVDVTQDDVTIDGLTFHPGAAGVAIVNVTGDDVVITNCDFSAGTTYSPALTDGLLLINGDDATVSNCSFDTTKAGPQTGIEVDTSKAKITDCTFKANSTDEAIDANADADISGVTVTGSSGIGVYVDGSTTKIVDSSFMTLTNAIYNVGQATVKNSVIDGCGSAVAGTGTSAAIYSDGELYMVNNTIQNSAAANYAIYLDSDHASIHFNSILNNAKNIYAEDGMQFCENNWWGTADGPAPGSVIGPDTIMPYLGNSVTSADMVSEKGEVFTSLNTKNTVGIDVAIIPGADDSGEVYMIGVAQYLSNPELAPPTIMGTGSVIGYYDVMVINDNVDDDDSVQIKFYVPVSPYTKIYYAGGISGRWADAGGDVNLASGFAYLTVGGVDAGLQVEDLGGTVFAIVEDKAKEAGPVQTSPTIGGYDVATEPMFTWNAVGGSIRYEIALSEDPTFTIIEWSYNVDQTFYKVDEPLRYDTTYYWRVRGVLGEPYQQGGQWLTPATPWTTSIFTTASEPLPPADPIIVQPTKPEVNVEIPPTKITIEPAEQAIPNYMLWIIVVVGAILIIALIVLIVRTRRVV